MGDMGDKGKWKTKHIKTLLSKLKILLCDVIKVCVCVRAQTLSQKNAGLWKKNNNDHEPVARTLLACKVHSSGKANGLNIT